MPSRTGGLGHSSEGGGPETVTPTTLEAMKGKVRFMLLPRIALLLAVVATGAGSPAFTDGGAPLATSGDERTPVLASDSLGSEVAVLASKLDQFRSHLWSRGAKGSSSVLLLGLAAAAWTAGFVWRRHRSLRAVPLVLAAPLSGIARRAPPRLRLIGH